MQIVIKHLSTSLRTYNSILFMIIGQFVVCGLFVCDLIVLSKYFAILEEQQEHRRNQSTSSFDDLTATPNTSTSATRPATAIGASSRNVETIYESNRVTEEQRSAMVCAAIDFGTTYSGYAYVFIDDPNKVLTNNWNGSKLKTPTVLLMDPNKQFHAFGEDAIEKYNDLIKENKHKEWYYFEKFKMQLFVQNTQLDRDMIIKDILGKTMKAITVFSEAIKYIRKHMMDALHEELDGNRIIRNNDIRWILTVPAIWDDMSKFFMREAAKEAGIPGELLTMALEPEAASLFCQTELKGHKIHKGCKYMVADLGGGTADITCQEDDTLKEITPPEGGDFGGTAVDDQYWKMLVSKFGGNIMKTFQQEHMDEYWEMMRDFEIKKRNFDGTGNVRSKFPVRLTEMFKNQIEMSLEDTRSQWPRNDISFIQDKIKFPEERMRAMFDVAVQKVVKLIQELLKKVGDLDYIILVGGFSESPYLQHVLKQEFDNILLLPKDPSLAVLQGAVIYGIENNAISSRRCRYTYGIARMVKFEPGIHPEKKKVKMENYTFCDDVFNKHIEIGTTVSLKTANDTKYQEYFPSLKNMNIAVLEVYKSKKKDPQFVDEDDCDLVGYIKAEGINPNNDIRCTLLVRLVFGGTELIVEVKDEKNNIHIRGFVDFLG